MICMKTNSFQVNPLFPLFCGVAAEQGFAFSWIAQKDIAS